MRELRLSRAPRPPKLRPALFRPTFSRTPLPRRNDLRNPQLTASDATARPPRRSGGSGTRSGGTRRRSRASPSALRPQHEAGAISRSTTPARPDSRPLTIEPPRPSFRATCAACRRASATPHEPTRRASHARTPSGTGGKTTTSAVAIAAGTPTVARFPASELPAGACSVASSRRWRPTTALAPRTGAERASGGARAWKPCVAPDTERDRRHRQQHVGLRGSRKAATTGRAVPLAALFGVRLRAGATDSLGRWSLRASTTTSRSRP